MLKKTLTLLYVMEKISNSSEVWEKNLPIQTKSVKSPIPHSPTNVQWSCQPFRGWRKKRIWHLCKCHPSTKWLARVHDVVVFKTERFAFQDWKYADKRHKWKEKVQKNAQFPFCGQTKAFRYEIFFRGIQPCFLHGRSEILACFEPIRQRGFWRHLRHIPYSMIKLTVFVFSCLFAALYSHWKSELI